MKKITIAVVVIIILFLSLFKIFYKKKNTLVDQISQNEKTYSANIIENVKYSSKDSKGNQYIITADEGEIDINNSNIIFLKNVNGIIKLKNANKILISSDFGKYNTINFDTIFSQNVIINYLQNQIKGGYLDFSILRNLMIISRNVIYTDTENTLKTDVIEINIETKDAKFFMYDNNNKVSIKKKK
jgi:hypothetical protein|tara:strand:+ start:55 stop:612 length:558 start_codon:yes stop_codon:yes gene_type:complete